MCEAPGQFGFVGANGGIMSKYSVGIYSTAPVEWRTDRSELLKEEIAALPKVPVTRNPDGPATIETYSVRYDWPIRTGFMAATDDEDLVALMCDGDPLGAAISVWSTEHGNRVSFA
jgi:acetyl-CoA C-acetyltransferase